ncbi:hypothetical protein [Dactylosporangium sp. CA-233914]|uniref:hypothetical protein n=1 Tax=Dactylosporangium sp. CA-233914 TaxID=3239934 RepID=UPI003D8F84BC
MSLPVVRTTRLISVSSSGVSARRVLGSRRVCGPVGRALRGLDECVDDGLVVEGAGGGDEQLAGVAAAAAVASGWPLRSGLVSRAIRHGLVGPDAVSASAGNGV